VLIRARELYLDGGDDDWNAAMPAVIATSEQILAEIDRLAKRDRRRSNRAAMP
jgi:hypothetical protein